MISLYLYPDQAISGVWMEWSDTTLNKKHPARFTTPTGFQLARGAINANDRTRAGEFFQLGLLRGLLVNPQGAGRTEMPYGWGLVQSDHNVHSHLGYLAYALGSAMKQGSPSRAVQEAFEVLCGIFLLQTGFPFKGQNFLTSSLFLYLQDSFNVSILGDTRYQRYLAAGMFCTLSMSERAQVMSQYISGQPVTELWLRTDTSQTRFAAADLPNIIATRRPSLSGVKPAKPSLYWIGDPNELRPRGLFAVAARTAGTLLKVAAEIERDAFRGNQASPFAGVIEKQTAGELPCVLETLKAIFSTTAEAGNEWRRAMDTLYKGVLEALRFLKNDGGVGESPQAFFAHGVKNSASADAIILEVDRSRCITEPRVDDAVIIRERTYVIKEVRANGTSFRIKIERIRQISSTERSATRFHVL